MTKDIFITNIKINKVRHLENIEIKLSQDRRKHLIITGNNGSGKTSLLLAMAEDVGLWNSGTTNFDITTSINIKVDFHKMRKENPFVLAFLKANRVTNNITDVSGPQKTNLSGIVKVANIAAHQYFLQYLVNLKVEKSFARDDGDTETVERIGKWFAMLETMFRMLFDDDTLKLQFDRQNYDFYFITKGREKFNFNQLADGYATVINIIADLIMRMEAIETIQRDVYDIQGFVLIDEIETHLHVDLQKKILPILTGFFPNIQFIVSTHSPFVLNSLKDTVIYDLEHRLRVEDLSPYPYETIIERYFDIDQYSTVIKQEMSEYEKLMSTKTKTAKEEASLLELRNHLKTIPSDFAPGLVAQFQAIEHRKR